MIPSDPRTWTDFRNPEAQGFEKVDCDTTLESALFAWGAALAFIAVWLAFEIYVHAPLRSRGYSHWYLSPALGPLLLPGLIAGSLMLFSLRALTDNFYLVDPVNHTVYYHFWFLFVRRVTLRLERKEILTVSTESRRRRSRYRSWWEQRVVVLAADARVVPMSNWQRDGVWACNNLASELAKKLDCKYLEVPEDTDLRVAAEAGRTTTFVPPYGWWGGWSGTSWLGAGLGLGIFGVLYLLGWMR
jgi:hypothetical protein